MSSSWSWSLATSSLFSSYFDPTTALFFAVVSLVAWYWYNSYNLPPGPWGLPVVGYFPFLGGKPFEESLNDLSRKYGNVMSVQLGQHQMIVLGSYEALKEAYVRQGDLFAGRPDGLLTKLRQDDVNVLATDGDYWKEHRRFCLSTFKDYGMGKLGLEPRIMEEIHFFLDGVAKQNGEAYDFVPLLGISTANIISTMAFGRRWHYDDPEFSELRRLFDQLIAVSTNAPVRAFLPWLVKFEMFERFTHEKKLQQIDDTLRAFMAARVKEHETVYEEESRKDYIDAYLTERRSLLTRTGSEGYFSHAALEGDVGIFYAAGTETTTSTLSWAIHLLMVHPELQAKLRREIDDVIGQERAPTMSDKTRMPMTDAFLLEVQRFGTVATVGVMHSNLEEAELFGYRIPKRSPIISNLWAVHFDPRLWKDPENFRPERYIDECTGKVNKPEYHIPFGIGKRVCLGEALARMELFLYFTSMLQRFTFQPPEGEPSPAKLSFESALARRPKPYKVRAVQRDGYHVTY